MRTEIKKELEKSASTIRELADRYEEMSKTASTQKNLLEAVSCCEILEKTGHLVNDGSPIVERAESLLARDDYQKLASIAEHGGRKYKVASCDNTKTDPHADLDAMDRGVLYGYGADEQ